MKSCISKIFIASISILLFPVTLESKQLIEVPGFIAPISGVWLLDSDPVTQGIQGVPLDAKDPYRGFEQIIMKGSVPIWSGQDQVVEGAWWSAWGRKKFSGKVIGSKLVARAESWGSSESEVLFSATFVGNGIIQLDSGQLFENIFIPE